MGHFHAYQMITKVQAISITAKNALKAAGVAAAKVVKKTAAVWIAPTMMLLQRFALYFKTRERRTMTMAVSIKTEKPKAAPAGMAAVDA